MIYEATLIFDFDGTLADSFQIHLDIFNQLTIKHRRRPLNENEIEQFKQLSMRDFIKQQKIPLWQLPSLIKEARTIQQTQHLEPKIFPPLTKIVPALATQYKLGILTSNTSANVERFLNHHNLSKHFRFVDAEPDLFGKHHKLKKLIKQYKLNPAETAYVGDEVRDIEAARLAGIKMIAVSWGFNSASALKEAKPNLLLKSPSDLSSLLNKKLMA